MASDDSDYESESDNEMSKDLSQLIDQISELLDVGAYEQAHRELKTMISYGYDIVGELFNWAIKNNNIEIVELLLDDLLDPNVPHYRKYPLDLALDTQDPEMIHLLLENGANPNLKKPYPFLSRMIGDQNMVGLQELLRFGADPNYSDVTGFPLISKLPRGKRSQEIADLLIKAGADINVILPRGDNLLNKYIVSNNYDMVEYLLNRNFYPNAKNNSGETPLTLAINSRGRPELIKVLLDFGANPNYENKNGESPLLLAARKKSKPEIFQLLIDYKENEHRTMFIFPQRDNGADPNIPRYGKTIYDYVKNYYRSDPDYEEIIEILDSFVPEPIKEPMEY